jgi:hypothetical protein
MALSDAHWAKVQSAIQLKAREDNINVLDMGAIFDLMQDNWELFGDEIELDKYIAAQELLIMKNERTIKEAELETLEAEIAERER